jgi:acyl carrier protein
VASDEQESSSRAENNFAAGVTQLNAKRGVEKSVAENNIGEKVIEIITREQHLEPGVVKPESSFAELGIDSLDAVNILFALEEEFKIDIPDTIAQNMKSVSQAVDGLTRVTEGRDISDLVAMAKRETTPATS